MLKVVVYLGLQIRHLVQITVIWAWRHALVEVPSVDSFSDVVLGAYLCTH